MNKEKKVILQREVLGKDFRCYGDIDSPLFLAKDVAEWIKYDPSKVNEMVAMVDADEKLTETISWSGQGRKMWFLTEEGLYEVMMQSRKPFAKEFKKQVKQILKDIRKHKVYATPQKLEEMLNDPDSMIRTLQALKTECDKVAALKEKVAKDRPKVIFADAVSVSTTSILVGDCAKIIKQNGVDIVGTRFFRWLREYGYLIKQKGTDYNMPTQKSMELDLFEIKETVITHSDGHITISKTPKVTGKGQVYFINKLVAA
ncbi:phage antirepressor [Clostridium vincentii]|uniref:Phage antirepressor protein KilAC domain protein n=1 Tax=Clostridium vincentii TaxID=52704 RepID=A0A2T0BKX9_9CLOT|nr:phage antirepressor KilAC domain-containing protein [Clostridium vincentii]PRR84554.1 Phage antirepressor protein KilAC domain protein [Clostridium vincentii]